MEESTQRELAELARRGIDAYNRGDIETVLEQLDEDVEVYTPPELPKAGTYRGPRRGRSSGSSWSASTSSVSYEVVTVRQFGRGAGSGVEVEMRIAQLYEVHDDKATRLHYYPDREMALTAAERLSREADQSA